MKIVVLEVRKKGRLTLTEACRLENEGVTLTGKYPSRYAELKAIYAGRQDVEIRRRVQTRWPDWCKRK